MNHNFASALDMNASASHKTKPSEMHHMHMEMDGKGAVKIEHHGEEHEVLAAHEFKPAEHKKAIAHVVKHLGLDMTKGPEEQEDSGDEEGETAAGAAW